MTEFPDTDSSADPSSTSTAEFSTRIRALPHAGMARHRWGALCALQTAIAVRETASIEALVLEAFPTHGSILEFEAAHRQARWPGSYGDSPVQHVADIATAFVHSRHLDQRGFILSVARTRNAAYQALVGLHGGPLLRRRFEVGSTMHCGCGPVCHGRADRRAT